MKYQIKPSIFLFAIVLFFNSLSAQESVIMAANKLYDARAYADAIIKYEKAMKKDSSNAVVLGKLGDCYRLTNNARGQVRCYGRLVSLGKAESLQKLYYGQALMELGRYDEAKQYVEGYLSDDRGKALAKAIENMKVYSKNEDAYKIDTVSFNSKENDFSPTFFVNNKVVFTSSRSKTSWITKKHGWTNNNYYTLYITEKDATGKYVKPKKFMKDLDSKYNDGPISITKDGRTIFFTRNNPKSKTEASAEGLYKLKIYEASLNVDGFERVKVMPFNNKEYNCAHPTVSADGNTLYFVSDMDGGQGGLDIYVSKKGANGEWGIPKNLGDKINTKGHEMFPFIASDGLLYFSSNGRDGLGGLDIYEVKFKENGKPGKVYNMGKPINSSYDDFGIIFTDDNKSGYLSSNRKNGNMDDDIYAFTVLRQVKRGKTVMITVKDKDSSFVLPNAKLKLNTDSVFTNEKGQFEAFIEEDTQYQLTASKEKYFNATDSLSTKMSEQDEFEKTIVLEKDPDLSLFAKVFDAKTNEPLSDVKITIKDLNANDTLDKYITVASGEYKKGLPKKRIGDKLKYKITLEKKDYVTKTLDLDYTITKPGEIKLQEVLNFGIGRTLIGMDLAKMIDIKPIYFDLGKSKIRPDAAIELDKVVKVMKEYPNIIIELGAHTDCRSAAAANLKLSTARAKASAAYIVSKGIAKTRISGKGYGESKLLNGCACEGKLVSNCTEAEHAQNRRTEFIITKLKEPKK